MDIKGKILALEECDEITFRLDRFLFQAARGEKINANAVLFGTAENMINGEQHDGSGRSF